jgi:multidrug efflux system outer membrane protein
MDLWGKLRNDFRAAMMDAQSKEYAYQASYLVLTAELAADYFQLRTLDTQLEILSGITQARQDFLAVVKERHRAGWVNGIDQTRAETLLYQAKTALSEASRERALLENAIAVLIGKPASVFHLEPLPLAIDPPSVPAGIPAQVLLQRPDIKEAERLVASANAQIGSKRAAFFPSLYLTGLFGYESPDLKDFFKWNSRFWSLDGLGKETLYDGGEHKSQLDYSWALFSQASADYQQHVLISFKEVEDALANLQYLSEETDILEKAAQSAQATAEITLSLYRNGQINYQDVAESARENLQQKQKSVENLSKRYTATIQLIKALGGSWCTP